MELERRFAEAPTIEDRGDGKAVLTGYAAVFYDGTPGTEYDMRGDGSVMERIKPGATFTAMESRGVVALFNHEPSMVLGSESGGTLRLSMDSRGWRYEIDAPATQLGRDTQELVRRGDIPGSSFTFRVKDGGQAFTREARSGKSVTVRELTAMEVLDVGPVTFPAYKATDVEVAKRAVDVFERESKPWRRENAKRRQKLSECY